VIDLHTHLLPGVDDGSPTLEHSALVLARMAGEGVHTVVCTPHLKASAAASAPVEEHEHLLAALRAAAPAGMTLARGFEIMLDVPDPVLADPRLSLGGSAVRLVEWQRSTVPPAATAGLAHLCDAGVRPLLAHVERYRGVTVERVTEWRRLGVLTQGDATYLLAGGDMGALAQGLLERGLIDVLASDNHGDRRGLAMARAWLQEIGAGEQGALLTEENPRRLLADEPLLPVPPVRLAKGFVDRLRSLFRGSA
jgi:protein-tyrosine phosphatase